MIKTVNILDLLPYKYFLIVYKKNEVKKIKRR